MSDTAYFTKIYFEKTLAGSVYSGLLLNLPAKELSYQEYGIDVKTRSINALHSIGIELSDADAAMLRPYCNAENFEPYRGRKFSPFDDGVIGYRDEISMTFTGISDSPYPKIELEMNDIHDEKHMPPQEKLYNFIVKEFFAGKSDGRKRIYYENGEKARKTRARGI